MSYFLLILNWRGNQAPSCSGSSEPSGLKKYKNGDDKGGTTSLSYSDSDSEDIYSLAGSFCAPSTGTYKLGINGQPAVYVKAGSSESKNSEHDCKGKDLTVEVSVYLNAHECIPYVGQCYQYYDWFGACVEPTMTVKVNGNTGSSSNFLQCQKSNCLYDWTGPQCQYKSEDVNYCNGHGTVRRGKRTDYIGCDCNKYGDNVFCENTGANSFSNQGMKVTLYEDFSTNSGTNLGTVAKINIENFLYSDYPYSKITKEGKIYVSQDSDLQFKVETYTYAKLYVYDGTGSTSKVVITVTAGSSEILCDPIGTLKTSSDSSKVTFSRGSYKIVLEYYPGCSLNKNDVNVYWKYYKWHYYDSSTPWESIPNRYLGTI